CTVHQSVTSMLLNPLRTSMKYVDPSHLRPHRLLRTLEHPPTPGEHSGELPDRLVHVAEVMERGRDPDHIRARVSKGEGLGDALHEADRRIDDVAGPDHGR